MFDLENDNSFHGEIGNQGTLTLLGENVISSEDAGCVDFETEVKRWEKKKENKQKRNRKNHASLAMLPIITSMLTKLSF